MSSTLKVDPISTGPTGFGKYLPHIFLTIGGLIMITNTILLGVNIGDQDTNNDLRKYVAVSVVPVVISLILIGIGLKMYFTQFPQYLPYAAVFLALIAVGVSNMSLCVSLIEKTYSAKPT